MNPASHAPFVVGLDGSAASMTALATSVELGIPAATPLVAVFARPHPSALAASTAASSEHRQAQAALANDIEAELMVRLADYPGSWQFDVRDGDPSHQLIQAAKDHQAKLVIVGHRGHNPVAGLLLGSVATSLINHCPVSVLVAR